MLITEAHTEFKFRYDKLDSLNYPNFEPEEIDLILNQAQDRIVKQRYGLTNTKKSSFEETQKRIEDLRTLIKTKVVLRNNINTADFENSTINSYNARLEENHWFIIWEKAIIECPGCTTNIKIPILEYESGPVPAPGGGGGSGLPSITYITVQGLEVEVRPTTHLELQKVVGDAFKGPDKTKVLRLMYRDRVELIASPDCSVITYIYRYIKEPVRVSLNGNITFELPEQIHTEIIDEAINIALEGTEAKRTGTFKQYIDNLKE